MSMHDIASMIVRSYERFLHAHLLLAFVVYMFILVSQRKHFRHLKVKSFTNDQIPFDLIHAPCVTLIMPVHNEGPAVIDSIEAALSSDYRNLEIFVVNDGSLDDTFSIIQERYALILTTRDRARTLPDIQPRGIYQSQKDARLLLIDKEHSGKAQSLNMGIEYARGDLLCCMDGDSIMLPDALPKLVTKFINEPKLIALGGAVAPSNQLSIRDGRIVRQEISTTFLEKIQVVEYLRSFTLWRTGWSYVDGLLIISGAMTVFTKQALVNIGGFKSDTVTEDLDVVLRLHQYYCEHQIPYHVWTIPNVICWTRVPKTLSQLRKQRIRWMIGALQCLSKFRTLIGNQQNPVLGWFALPHLIFIEVFAPVIEFLGLLVLIASAVMGLLSYQSAIVYGFLIYALTGFYSWNSIYAGDIYFKNYSSLWDDLRVGLVGLIEPIGYRQLDSIWRMIGWWKWLSNKKIEW